MVEYLKAYARFLGQSNLPTAWGQGAISLAILLLTLLVLSRDWKRISTTPERQSMKALTALAVSLGVSSILLLAIYNMMILGLAPTQNPVGWEYARLSPSFRLASLWLSPAFYLVTVLLFSRSSVEVPATSSNAARTVAGSLIVLFGVLVVFLYNDSASEPLGWLAENTRVARPLGDWDFVRLLSFRQAFEFPGIVLFAGTLILLGPLAEELFWRGVILPFIEPLVGRVWAVILSATLFMTAHVQWLDLDMGMGDLISPLSALVLGVILGIVFVRRRSLRVCFLLHCSWNVIVFLLVVASII